MEMNQYFAYAFAIVVVLCISLLAHKPKLVFLVILTVGLSPLFFLRWVVEPFHQRGWWLVMVVVLAGIMYIACTAQLALSIARALQVERKETRS
jgi:hypothetical protein